MEQQYEAESIDGTKLNIIEKFNFDQPKCPGTKKNQAFEKFKCFDYVKDTEKTTAAETTTTTTASTTVAVPTEHIAIIGGLGGATVLVLLAIVIYKIKTS